MENVINLPTSQSNAHDMGDSRTQRKQIVEGPSPFGFVQRAFWNNRAILSHDNSSRQDPRHFGDHIVQNPSIWHPQSASVAENMEIDEPETQPKPRLIRKSDDGRFHCTQCPKNYRQSSHLNRHMKEHENSQMFTCNVCDHNFSRR
jgi:hypothetical protein